MAYQCSPRRLVRQQSRVPGHDAAARECALEYRLRAHRGPRRGAHPDTPRPSSQDPDTPRRRGSESCPDRTPALAVHPRRTLAFTSGFTIIAIEQDGSLDQAAQVAKLTGLWRRNGWPGGLRYIARGSNPPAGTRRISPTSRRRPAGGIGWSSPTSAIPDDTCPARTTSARSTPRTVNTPWSGTACAPRRAQESKPALPRLRAEQARPRS